MLKGPKEFDSLPKRTLGMAWGRCAENCPRRIENDDERKRRIACRLRRCRHLPKVYPVRALRTIINENNRSRDSAFSSRYPPVRLICHAILKGQPLTESYSL